jgi:signal transduction histidine kinase
MVLLVTDVIVVSGITWVFAFDDVSALFAILFLLPIEGAVLFGFAGSVWTWVALTALYVGREFFALRYDNPFGLESVTFRVGLIGIVAFIVGALVRDLETQRRATADALEASKRVEESRARLISMLAHDVRAPIAAARMALETLRTAGDRIDDTRKAEVLAAGRRQTDRAMLLVRDLLDLARVESGSLTVTPTVVDLATLVTAVSEVLPGEVDLRVDLGGLAVQADQSRLEQVVYNVIDNALKYGAQPIEVTAQPAADEVVLTIRDHGPGIPDGVELFEAFSHAGEGSVGLGMWIVRQLVEANGGSITHHAGDPGAVFEIRLPAGPSATTATPDDGHRADAFLTE